MASSSGMKEAGIKVCCTSGTPHAGDYVGHGEVINLSDDLRGYHVGKGGSHGVVLVYDIFGLDIGNTRQFADKLAEGTGLNILMPDFFRGNAWKIENFPPKNQKEFKAWLDKDGSWDIVHKDLELAAAALHSWGAKGPLGIVGFCWGGKQAIRACALPNYGAGVSVHGAWLGPEDAQVVRCPMMFLPAGDDPSVDELKAVLDKKPFGSSCVYKTFEHECHGFAAARGDWKNNKRTFDAAMEANKMAADFLVKHLSVS